MSMNDNDLKCYRGSQANGLNVVMYNDDDYMMRILKFTISTIPLILTQTNYLGFLEDQKITILSLNIQSISAKWNSFYAPQVDLADEALQFSAICLQENWLAVNSDVSHFEILNHKMYHQDRSRCIARVGL